MSEQSHDKNYDVLLVKRLDLWNFTLDKIPNRKAKSFSNSHPFNKLRLKAKSRVKLTKVNP